MMSNWLLETCRELEKTDIRKRTVRQVGRLQRFKEANVVNSLNGFILETRQATRYDVILWRVHVIFIPLGYPNSLKPFHSKRAMLCPFDVTGKNVKRLKSSFKSSVVLSIF